MVTAVGNTGHGAGEIDSHGVEHVLVHAVDVLHVACHLLGFLAVVGALGRYVLELDLAYGAEPAEIAVYVAEA